jgi:hypothetical protein
LVGLIEKSGLDPETLLAQILEQAGASETRENPISS